MPWRDDRHRGSAYLADAFPKTGPAPPPHDRRCGPYYRWLFFTAGQVEAAITDKALGVAVPENRQRMVGYGTFAATMDVPEQAVSASGCLVGDQFSAAEVSVGSQSGSGCSSTRSTGDRRSNATGTG